MSTHRGLNLPDRRRLPRQQLHRLHPACTGKSRLCRTFRSSRSMLSGLEKNPGFKLTLPLIQHGLYALEFGDIFMRCRLRNADLTRRLPDPTDELHEKWKKEVYRLYYPEKDALPRQVLRKCAASIIRDFDNLPRKDIKKPTRRRCRRDSCQVLIRLPTIIWWSFSNPRVQRPLYRI